MSCRLKPPPPVPAPATAKRRDWAPRFWEGADFFAWMRLAAGNRFAVEFPYWYIGGIVSMMSAGHMGLRWLQNGMYGDRIARTRIEHPPLFVIGHWRTGTTLLHELLILDDRHAYPNTYHCFDPNHVLLTEAFFRKYLNFLLPDRRPMDNMAAGWGRPQEDEFALVLLGQPSTYADVAFPNRPPLYPGALDLSGLSPTQLRAWKRTFYRFLQTLTYDDPRRLVLKSPPHTARVPTLLELFPDARFVHIVRDPHVVFPSTVNLWTSLAKKHGFQTPRRPDLVREKVFSEFRVIYDRLEEARPLFKPGQFCEVRYEDFVKDPASGLRRVYDELELGGYEAVRPKVEDYVRNTSGYETNKYTLSEADRQEVSRRWGDVIRRYGYG